MFNRFAISLVAMVLALLQACTVIAPSNTPSGAATPQAVTASTPSVNSTTTPTHAPSANVAPSSQPSPSPTATETPLPSVASVSIEVPAGVRLGVTYSLPHANWLFGSYFAAQGALRELARIGFKRFRLEAYWNWLQDSGRGTLKRAYNLDWQLGITAAASADTVIMCVGRKVPHWPEFHVPAWVQELSEAEQKKALLEYLALLVDAYATDARITHWQVENEVFFAFGSGSAFSDQANFLREEIAVIRAHDTLARPIIVTESGDKGNWEDTAAFGDILGVSFYGISYENGVYVTHANGSPEDWKTRSNSLGKNVFLTELQAEPWGPSSNKDISYAESLKSMTPTRLKEHLDFVTKAGFTDVFLWGAKWWLWMRDQGHPEMLNTVAPLAARP